MTQGAGPIKRTAQTTPYWSQVLRALRNSRGVTQEGWAAQLGYSRATVRRWESGHIVPSADAEREIIELCRSKRLFQTFGDGPLRGVQVSPDWIGDLLAMARLQAESKPEVTGSVQNQALVPPVYYAANGDVSLAYQVFGKGPVTFVITPGTISHRELDWENTGMRAFLLHLAQAGRVIIYDKRATGLSDRVSDGSITDRINDLRAVMDATECEHAVLIGFTEGGPISIKFAATWPERVKALVLYGTSAQVSDVSPEIDTRSFDRLRRVWGTTDSGFLRKFAPSVTFDQQEQEWWARYQRMGASPGAIRDLNVMNATLDVHALLPEIHTPTLVVHRTGDLVTPFQEAVHLTRAIPGARLVALEGDDHLAWAGEAKEISGAILDFVSDLILSPPVTQVLTTLVIFSHHLDGDQLLWKRIRQQPSYLTGREALAPNHRSVLTFDSPSNAMLFALDLLESEISHEFRVGVGIHTGEVDLTPQSISGDAVTTCAVLAELADPGVVLVSDTVARLVSSPDFSFRKHIARNGNEHLDGMEILDLKYRTV